MLHPRGNRERELYVDLLIRCISNTIYKDPSNHPASAGAYDEAARQVGADWPARAHSMAGVARLRNLADLTQRVLDEGIPGDFIETGVWRGGCCILMKGVLAANQVVGRKVYACDSFQGLPVPNVAKYPADADLDLSQVKELKVSVEEVRTNFAAYDLLDAEVVFVEGFFAETLPKLNTGGLALMRLDGDLSESTIVALEALYPQLSPGGYVIIDDYGAVSACAAAVQNFRAQHQILSPMNEVDWTGLWWRKT